MYGLVIIVSMQKLHYTKLNSKKDFTQDYCNGREKPEQSLIKFTKPKEQESFKKTEVVGMGREGKS